jgi:L-serine dehydratase
MISVFELFKIGIGPSSSHTVGPMRAANHFLASLREKGHLDSVARVEARFKGSLAWTGHGHATDRATLLGLAGQTPEKINPENATFIVDAMRNSGTMPLAGIRTIGFDAERDLIFDKVTRASRHPNAMTLSAFDADGSPIFMEEYFSIGGGFIVAGDAPFQRTETIAFPFPFRTAEELVASADAEGLPIASLILANEGAIRPERETRAHLSLIRETMDACIDRGLVQDGLLPGGLNVKRRAKALHEKLLADGSGNMVQPHRIMDWVSLYAIAVNEENAAGGRIVTAPTNGAAGIVPAVLRYYRNHCAGASEDGADDFLLTATAIGALCKMNASISGAEVGCQGEIGVAASMAAAGLAAALGASNAQIENAAEIAMEHHLGMTCDPIGGLVQIPCIERNAFGANKAIAAASLAMRGDGTHQVSLDKVILTMRRTGEDMHDKYKETSQGGLALSAVEC